MKYVALILLCATPLAFAENNNAECSDFTSAQICDSGPGDVAHDGYDPNGGLPGGHGEWPFVSAIHCSRQQCELRYWAKVEGINQILRETGCAHQVSMDYTPQNCSLSEGNIIRVQVNVVNFPSGTLYKSYTVTIYVTEKTNSEIKFESGIAG